MTKKINQIVIEKVENGFICVMQKNNSHKGLFTTEVSDKEIYVANDIKTLIEIIEKESNKMESAAKTKLTSSSEENPEEAKLEQY